MKNFPYETTAIIRKRGQMTIPDEIREKSSWLTADSVVTLQRLGDETLLLRPYVSQKTPDDWKKLWKMIRRVRSFKGARGNLSQFIVKDRETHF